MELDEKCTPKMECMLSCLPSVTSVGMASLLPHKEMQVDGSLNVTVDGQACASMEQRDKPASENEVFNACAEAIEEIHKLVKKLTGYVSAPKFFITADHGFLYKRDRLQEFDKVTYPKDKCLYTNKRFLITEDAVKRDDKIDLFEVPSKSDDPDKLVERMKEVNKQLGDRAGDINLVYIKK